MKKILCSIALVVMALASISAVTPKSGGKASVSLEIKELENVGTGGGLGYSNTCPGIQGKRHSQVVFCSATFWNGIFDAHAGCMSGDEFCDNMNPCDGGKFSSEPGGKVWCNPSTEK